ncbi:hypothetical protein [Paenibacillus sp. Aloe-11]|uniref:hypothetical protein n=1 Tax=Paenibacillus sp. Aloe-11 TaxID=1050222 RepID=UPI00024EFF8D|nr:hypothetical protein [Paenibacillus sp. Aloe-11]EHS59424.1 hypothetical protein WG8_0639 [Paenibacillus sp. Aloe-11]
MSKERIREIKERFEFNLKLAESIGATGGEYKDIPYLLDLVDSLQQQATKWEKAFDNADKNYLKMEHEAAELRRQLVSKTDELAERDRTIARLSADLDTSVASQLNMTDKAYRYQKALEEAKAAIQKNLAFANGKDEQSLLSAFNHINTALGRE